MFNKKYSSTKKRWKLSIESSALEIMTERISNNQYSMPNIQVKSR